MAVEKFLEGGDPAINVLKGHGGPTEVKRAADKKGPGHESQHCTRYKETSFNEQRKCSERFLHFNEKRGEKKIGGRRISQGEGT